MKGKFITFEGIDGAGKSTHVMTAVEQLRTAGLDVVQTREPGGTPLSETLRNLFLKEKMAATTELLLVFAARREHLEQVIWPSLARGAWVVCDRFTDATVAYQGFGRALGHGPVDALVQFTHPGFAPDLTLWFDVPPVVAAGRLAAGRSESDRFEQEQIAFFERVREGYATVASEAPHRVKRIDSSASMDAVTQTVKHHIGELVR